MYLIIKSSHVNFLLAYFYFISIGYVSDISWVASYLFDMLFVENIFPIQQLTVAISHDVNEIFWYTLFFNGLW